MAFPWVTEENFEDGTLGHFDAETDVDGRLDFPHYSTLARIPGAGSPYRGAYCMRVGLAGASNPAYVQETGSWDMTAGSAELYLRMYFRISADLVMANTNEFGIMEFWSSTSTPEAGAYINYTTANGYRIGIGKASASSFKQLSIGDWHCLELFFDPAGSSNGTLDGWLNGSAFAQVTGLTNASITSGVVGVVGQDAGTTAGTVLFDQIVTDDARVFPITDRWDETLLITKSQHIAMGPGKLDNLSLYAGNGTDCVAEIYDTDTGYTSDAGNVRLRLSNLTANEFVDPAGTPIHFHRGCFVALTGTTPRAIVKLCQATAWGSEGAVRSYGVKRSPTALGV